MKRRCKKALAGVVLATAATCRADPIGAEIETAIQAVRVAKPGSDEQRRAGQRFCQLMNGPLSVATWTDKGELKCKRVTDKPD